MSAPAEPRTSVCPGCGAVLAVVPGLPGSAEHPDASASCAGLFGVTLRGAREEPSADVRSAAVAALADAAYDAQHTLDPARLSAALVRLRAAVEGGGTPRTEGLAPLDLPRPAEWTSTVADVAADLDVVDLPTLVRSWAEAVWRDWAAAHERVRRLVTTGG